MRERKPIYLNKNKHEIKPVHVAERYPAFPGENVCSEELMRNLNRNNLMGYPKSLDDVDKIEKAKASVSGNINYRVYTEDDVVSIPVSHSFYTKVDESLPTMTIGPAPKKMYRSPNHTERANAIRERDYHYADFNNVMPNEAMLRKFESLEITSFPPPNSVPEFTGREKSDIEIQERRNFIITVVVCAGVLLLWVLAFFYFI